jgi:hypothetical protein
MQKKQGTTIKYLSIKISFKEIFDLQEILKLYFLEQETLAYKDTKDIKCYKLNERLKHLVALYELENPSVED